MRGKDKPRVGCYQQNSSHRFPLFTHSQRRALTHHSSEDFIPASCLYKPLLLKVISQQLVFSHTETIITSAQPLYSKQ